MTGRLLAWMPLLVLGTACPSTWGKEGHVQKTFHKNLEQLHSQEYRSCPLDEEDWLELCGEEINHEGSCPKECPLPRQLGPR
ncbi:hypothetical protein KYC5002_07790 [Archangium violaceum]|uniref:hypothetical protein n=1 Tax=Archangium violaceum TaxID=83451 RepID=UPI002B2E00A9|nr:hypothetical protein KYC5002_07790 [Archangium gephyra]